MEKIVFNCSNYFSLKNFKDNYMHHVYVGLMIQKKAKIYVKLIKYTTYHVVKIHIVKMHLSLEERKKELKSHRRPAEFTGRKKREARLSWRPRINEEHVVWARIYFRSGSGRFLSLFSVFPFWRNRRDVSHFFYRIREKSCAIHSLSSHRDSENC